MLCPYHKCNNEQSDVFIYSSTIKCCSRFRKINESHVDIIMMHVSIIKSHVYIIMLHVDINESHDDIIMLHVDINKSHVDIIMLHVACIMSDNCVSKKIYP